MVDNLVLRNKIEFIGQCLMKLTMLRNLAKEEFLGNFQAIDSTKYNLQVAIEAIIDISTHIVSREKWGIPVTS